MHCLRRIILIVAAMGGLLLGVGIPDSAEGPAHAADPTRLSRVGDAIAAEGTLARCVFEYVGQGLPLAEAAKHCNVDLTAVPGGADLPAAGGGAVALGGFRSPGGGGLTVSCAGSSGADPNISSGARDALADAKKALAEFDKTHPAPYGREVFERDALAKKVNEAQDAVNNESTNYDARLEAAKATKKMLDDAAGNTAPATPEPPPATPPTTAAPATPPPPPTTAGPSNTSPITTAGSAVARPVDGVDQACAAFAAFVGECNLAGWATSPCQGLRRQLRGCVDMTIAYTTGDDPNAGCPMDDPDAETVAKVVDLVCMSDAKVAPGYDPCAPRDLGGGPGMYRDANADPCSGKNPYALTTPDGCAVTVNESPDFGLGPTIDPSMILILGGPVVPSTNPPPPPYMPKP